MLQDNFNLSQSETLTDECVIAKKIYGRCKQQDCLKPVDCSRVHSAPCPNTELPPDIPDSIRIGSSIFTGISLTNVGTSTSPLITDLATGDIIEFDDNPSLNLTWNNCIIKSVNTENITFRNFRIIGSLEKYPDSMKTNALPLMNIDKCNNVVIDGVTLENCRTVTTQIGDCKKVKIINSSIKNSLRDGFRCVNCSDVIIMGNYLFNVADDCITVSSVNDVTNVPSNTIISNNIIRMSQGIKALGGKNITISNNQFKLCHNTAISVCRVLSGSEGLDIPMNVVITDNIIQDNIRFQQFSEGALIIDIIGTIKSTIDSKIIGLTQAPYNYTWVKNSEIQGAFENIIVKNNLITRTLPPVTKISEYGYGSIIIRDGKTPFNDLPITEDSFNTYFRAIFWYGCLFGNYVYKQPFNLFFKRQKTCKRRENKTGF